MSADVLAALIAAIAPTSAGAARAAAARHDRLAKPPGSLGALERLGARLAGMARADPPPAPERPAVVVAAADHGVHARGVSAWPQALTAAMVELICAGRASVNQIAAVVAADVAVLDVGCASEPPDHPLLRKTRVRAGTADLLAGPAMTRADAVAATTAGAQLARDLVAGGADLLVTGDMGIANTTASACLVAACTGRAAAEVTGRGAGADEDALARKVAVVEQALVLHEPDPADPVGVLAAVGGLEHAALVGVVLAGAAARVPVVLDGLATNAAALIAAALAPDAAGYLVASHRSIEPGAAAALDHLGLEPLLDLGLRLGEGAGGLLAVPLIAAAARVLAGSASIDDVTGGR